MLCEPNPSLSKLYCVKQMRAFSLAAPLACLQYQCADSCCSSLNQLRSSFQRAELFPIVLTAIFHRICIDHDFKSSTACVEPDGYRLSVCVPGSSAPRQKNFRTPLQQQRGGWGRANRLQP